MSVEESEPLKTAQSGLVKIVAEIGVNHNGSVELAKELVSRSAAAGADYAKFQLYNTSEFIHKNSIYYKEFSRERLSYEKFLKF